GIASLTGQLAAVFTDPKIQLGLGVGDIRFRFNVTASATPMTRAEFVARQTAEALRLRTAILADAAQVTDSNKGNRAFVNLGNLAADSDTWVAAYLGAL